MAAGDAVAARLDDLIALFNKKSMDLPDALFDRHTQFVLNGVSFEETLGRSPTDPLILMLARGPAGYRFIAKAVQHALPDARAERGEVSESPDGTVRGQVFLSGRLRGTDEDIRTMLDASLTLNAAGAVAVAAVSLDRATLDKLREARHRP